MQLSLPHVSKNVWLISNLMYCGPHYENQKPYSNLVIYFYIFIYLYSYLHDPNNKIVTLT